MQHGLASAVHLDFFGLSMFFAHLTDFLTSWLTRWPTSLLLTYDVLRLGSPWEAGGAQQPEGLQDWVSNHQSPSDRVAVCISVMCVSWHLRAPMVPGWTYDLKYNFPLTPDLRWLVGWLVLLSMHFFFYIANFSITSWSYYHLLANSRNCLLLIFTYLDFFAYFASWFGLLRLIYFTTAFFSFLTHIYYCLLIWLID